MLSYSLVLFLFSQAHLLSLAEALCMMFWAWKMTQFSAYNVVDSFYGSTRELVSLSSDRSTDVLSVFSSRAKKTLGSVGTFSVLCEKLHIPSLTLTSTPWSQEELHHCYRRYPHQGLYRQNIITDNAPKIDTRAILGTPNPNH